MKNFLEYHVRRSIEEHYPTTILNTREDEVFSKIVSHVEETERVSQEFRSNENPPDNSQVKAYIQISCLSDDPEISFIPCLKIYSVLSTLDDSSYTWPDNLTEVGLLSLDSRTVYTCQSGYFTGLPSRTDMILANIVGNVINWDLPNVEHLALQILLPDGLEYNE